MNLLCENRSTSSSAKGYATRDDFRELFTEDMTALHLLAYLLTGDQEKAEQCFVTGLEDSVNNNSVFKEWARSWAQRTIVQSAIRMMAPRPDHAVCLCSVCSRAILRSGLFHPSQLLTRGRQDSTNASTTADL